MGRFQEARSPLVEREAWRRGSEGRQKEKRRELSASGSHLKHPIASSGHDSGGSARARPASTSIPLSLARPNSGKQKVGGFARQCVGLDGICPGIFAPPPVGPVGPVGARPGR